MKQYIIDAFTNKPFSGNPAAVCVMDSQISDSSMIKLAKENNLSETAFIIKKQEGYRLRWFTPAKEIDLCGHATLASAFVILNYLDNESSDVCFDTLSGKLTVKRNEGFYAMDFPTYELREIPVTADMKKAYGIRPIKALLGLDLICIFENEDYVRHIRPDPEFLMKLQGRIQNATAQGRETDCVSRSFGPKFGILEDPVCGSAHCQIADYWANALNKNVINAYQASERGGYLRCESLENGRISIGGEAVPVAVSDIIAPL